MTATDVGAVVPRSAQAREPAKTKFQVVDLRASTAVPGTVAIDAEFLSPPVESVSSPVASARLSRGGTKCGGLPLGEMENGIGGSWRGLGAMLGSRFDLAETLTEIAQREQVFDEQVVGGHAGATTVENELCPEVADLGYHCVELELQMAEVARLVHHNNPRISFRCPICDSRMQLSCETVMSEFAALDIKHHELSCDTCGLTTLRAFHALVGYQELPR